MLKFNVNGKDYEVIYNYNCFCDTDLLDRVSSMVNLFEDGTDASSVFDSFKDLFITVRSLLFVGLQKNYSDEFKTEKETGNFIDDLVNDNDISIEELLDKLFEELTERGFLSSLLSEEEAEKELPKPQDHKKSSKK